MSSSFSPTQAELALVNGLFAHADPNKLGIITGDAAVKAFGGAKLQPTVLGEIWALADSENNGFLTRKGVAIAIRLIGHAQSGQQVKESLIDSPGPLAHIEGISPSVPSRVLSPPPVSPRSPRAAQLHPPLTPEDKTKFLRLFLGCGPVNGLLSGDKARDVFVKSKLPYDQLSQIWALADTQDRGSLDQTDFTVAMYLIQAIMSGQMKALPPTLPPALYEQAGGRAPMGVTTHGTGSSISNASPSINGSFAGVSTLNPQMTGQNPNLSTLRPQTTGQDYNRMSMALPAPQQQAPFSNAGALLGASVFGGVSQAWDVTPEEKARFDQFFDNLDTQRHGFIEGDVAVPFMLQSKLSEDVLAQVWDLADLNNDGRLTRDGFAVGMHLIQSKLAGKEIPSSLPQSLIPPAMRGNRQTMAPAPPAPAPAPVSEIQDLLWDDEPVASAPPPTAISPPPAASPAVQQFTPLQPQSTGTLSAQATGANFQSARAPPPPIPQRNTDPFGAPAFAPPPAISRDFLADDEESAPAKVPDNSAEIGNLQNQLASTNRSLETTKADRQSIEKQIESQAAQLAALETQLSSAKAAYETETHLLAALRERFSKQAADIASAREQLIRAESDLSATRVEKAELEGSLLRDKEEVRDLQRRMKDVGEEMERDKASIEKAKKETKHQKGMLAIAKKQLATREAEKTKVAKELEEAQQETQQTIEDLQNTEAEIANAPYIAAVEAMSPEMPNLERNDSATFAAMQPLPMSRSVSPPASLASPSSGKTNNPFERLVKQNTGSRPATPLNAAPDIFSISPTQLQTEASSEPPRASSPFSIQAEAPLTTTGAGADTDPFAPSTEETPSTAAEPSPEEDLFKADPAEPALAEPEVAASDSPKEIESDATPKAPELPSETSPGVEAAAAFPPLSAFEAATLPAPAVAADEKKPADDTDLNSKLVEKEDETDSDSGSDDEGEFHDAVGRDSIGSPRFEGSAIDKKPAEVEKAIPAPASTFDDAFGFNSAPASSALAAPRASSETQDLFFTPPTTLKGKANGKLPETSSPFDAFPPLPTASGLNAFDEALGKLSTSSSSVAPQFKLDAGFDDTFDFSAAKAELDSTSGPFPPPATNGVSHAPATSTSEFGSMFNPANPAADGSAKAPEPSTNGFSFDDAFGTPKPAQDMGKSPAIDHGIAFEDAFGGAGGSQALELKNSFDENPSQPSATSSGLSTEQARSSAEAEHTPVPAHLPPKDSVNFGRTPRSPSPPPRRSTGSSTDGAPSLKSPQRTSKLSIRLPFGRNKDKKKKNDSAKHDPPPIPSHFLSPVAEPAGEVGSGTPAVDDDVEPVKQLCGMGFSRSQAVIALEKHGYDVQRALNSLLGAQ